MKNIFILLLAIGFYSCGSESSKSVQKTLADSTRAKADTLNFLWINDFREFRNAVYQGDVNKVKTYFKFPVLNYNNEIWALTLTNSDQNSKNSSSDTIIPFTEKDFTQYFKKLFPKEFISSILKIKSEELSRKDNSSTEYFTQDSATIYKMIASFDKENKVLTLNLFFNRNIKDENGDDLDGGESSIIYNFVLQNNGHILFKEIRLAG